MCDVALEEAYKSVRAISVFEDNFRGKKLHRAKTDPAFEAIETFDIGQAAQTAIDAVRRARKRRREAGVDVDEDVSDKRLTKLTRWTNEHALEGYKHFLYYVPRLVNVVTMSEALPALGSGIKLPLDLKKIASCCDGAFYSPKRFSAVQLAFESTRCRVLVFHTGRLVGTGCQGPAAAMLSMNLAVRQIAVQAGIPLVLRSFSIINTVGAASLGANLNCDGFAAAHSSTAHYDTQSFVGLCWRPPRSAVSLEVYGTGKGNLPGSIAVRQLHGSYLKMLGELLRFTTKSHLRQYLSKDVRDAYLTEQTEVKKVSMQPRKKVGLWDDWVDADEPAAAEPTDDDELDDAALAELGL